MISLKKIYENIFVNELFVHGDKNNAYYLIGYKENVWLLPDDALGKFRKEIKKAVGHGGEDRFFQTVDDVKEFAELKYLPIIVGIIDSGDLYLQSYQSQFDPKSSIIIKKIVDTLKLKSVSYAGQSGDGDETFTTKKKKIKGQIPNIGYHGTSSKYLYNILNKGLMPDISPSNYPKVIKHGDLIFFSTRFDEALMHAQHTSDKIRKEVHDMSLPIVIEFSIPDENRLVPDYDVAAWSQQTMSLSQQQYLALQKEKQPFARSKEFGIWGYKGRISGSNIKYVYIPDMESVSNMISNPESIYYLGSKNFKKFTSKNSILKYLEKIEMYY